jgi:hypothetical protein
MWRATVDEGRIWRPCVAAVVVLSAAVVGVSAGGAPGAARAAGAAVSSPRGPYIPARGLALSVPDELKVGRRADVSVEGSARAGDTVSVFVDRKSTVCADSAFTQGTRQTPLISEIVTDGFFRLGEEYRPEKRGEQLFCAYLTPPSGMDELQESEARTVKAKRLRRSVARAAAVTALRRHGYAHRVVKAVDPECKRRRRDEFACAFEVDFKGYHLRGSGRVRLGVDLSYRFRVKAQGVRFTLTDENEERRAD